jgi:nucleoside-diphosphate-sugar epimerase/dTDP-glucose pyrophosphorylase
MHAVILAGGKGVRLRPYTTLLPKALVPIGDRYSILEIIMRQLAGCGFRTVTLAIGHLGNLVRAYVGDGTQWGLDHVDYAAEDRPLGTLGPLLRLRDDLPEHFVVMNSDILTDLNYADLLERHVASGAELTVATCSRHVQLEFGVLNHSGGRVTGFAEKPSLQFHVSMGVYGMTASVLQSYPPGLALGFDALILDLLGSGRSLLEYEFDGRWLDIGLPADYDRANAEIGLLDPLTTVRPRAAERAVRCLLLGATGFLGGHVRAQLRATPGVMVVPSGRSGQDAQVPLDLAAATPEDVAAVLRSAAPDVVINCAGSIGDDPAALTAGNVVAVAALLAGLERYDAGRHRPGDDRRATRLLHLGSAAEYGAGTPGRPIAEDAPTEPTSAYGITKLAGTALILAARRDGREATVLRVFNPIGPGTPSRLLPGRLAAELRRSASTGQRARVGNLDGHRDFIDVRDVAAAVVAAARSAVPLPPLLNVGSGRPTALRDLAAVAADLAGVPAPVEDDTVPEMRSAGVSWQQADLRAITSALDWKPRIPLTVSLRDMGLAGPGALRRLLLGREPSVRWWCRRRAREAAISPEPPACPRSPPSTWTSPAAPGRPPGRRPRRACRGRSRSRPGRRSPRIAAGPVHGRLERTGGAVNLLATALRPLRALPVAGAAVPSRDFR